jgi:magnesium transporter
VEIRVQSGEGRTGVSEVVALEDLAALVETEAWLWVDVCGAEPGVAGELGRAMGLVDDGIEDIQDIELLPKVEDYGDQLFAILHSLVVVGDRIDTVEVDCFLGASFLVTVHSTEVPGIDWLWGAVSSTPVSPDLDYPSGIFARLAEVIGRRYLELMLAVDKRVEELASAALSADPQVPEAVQLLRRETAVLRRVLRPQRYALGSGILNGSALFGEVDLRRLATALEFHEQLVDGLAEIRATLAEVTDTYRAGVAEQQAEVSKVLTVYAAVLLPLSLVAGFFGMNFIDLPLTGRSNGWIVVTVAMGLMALASWLIFVRRGWMTSPRSVTAARSVGATLVSAARAPLRAPERDSSVR